MPFSTKNFFQIISIMKRGSISQTLVNMVRLYTAKRIKRTWSTLSSHNWLEFSRFISHFFVLGFMILFFYITLIFCCVDFFNGIPSPKTVKNCTNLTFTYQSSSIQDSRAIQHCTNIITEGVHRHLTIFRKKDTL